MIHPSRDDRCSFTTRKSEDLFNNNYFSTNILKERRRRRRSRERNRSRGRRGEAEEIEEGEIVIDVVVAEN
jgi:hypothetical protein